MPGEQPCSAPSDRAAERRRQQLELELAVATASALPQRDPGPLQVPPFRTLVRQ
jgi:hypothetical protein